MAYARSPGPRATKSMTEVSRLRICACVLRLGQLLRQALTGRGQFGGLAGLVGGCRTILQVAVGGEAYRVEHPH
jgi:hypothetical protein